MANDGDELRTEIFFPSNATLERWRAQRAQDAFVPLFDDQQHYYATEPPTEDREYDGDHEQWLTRHSDR